MDCEDDDDDDDSNDGDDEVVMMMTTVIMMVTMMMIDNDNADLPEGFRHPMVPVDPDEVRLDCQHQPRSIDR